MKRIFSKKFLWILIPISFLFVFIIYRVSLSPHITKNEIVIEESAINIQNYNQYLISGRRIQLGESDGKLYFSMAFSSKQVVHRYYLSVFKNRSVKRVFKPYDDMGIANGYFYYREVEEENYKSSIYSYNLNTKETTLILENVDYRDYFFSSEGFLYINCSRGETTYLEIDGDHITGVTVDHGEEFLIGDTVYYLKSFKYGERNMQLYRREPGGEKEIVEGLSYGRKLISPCKNGLLVHLYEEDDILYHIDEAGNVTKLFSIESTFIDSSFNVYGDYAYVSVIRYRGFGNSGIGLARYENDELEGTYRINLDTFEVEKISDGIYQALYIFDSTGIYAADYSENIYKLDFDGNVIDKLLWK